MTASVDLGTGEIGLPGTISPVPGPTARSGRAGGVAMMVASALSNQVGAAVGALGFPAIGAVGVVAIRQWIAAAVLVTVGRPRWRTFTRREWLPVLALAAVYATMNVSLYTSIDRIGLGLAVTLEFLGPLAVALASTRRWLDLGCAAAVGGAVVVLIDPRPSTDYVGIGLGLLAAACWAGYILLNRVVGRLLPGVQGSGAAAGCSALIYVPIGIALFVHHAPDLAAVGCAAAAGIGSSAIPFLVDLLVLRRVPARFYGIFMSINPMLAALIGWAILDQTLHGPQWAAMGVIVAANAISVATVRAGTG